MILLLGGLIEEEEEEEEGYSRRACERERERDRGLLI
jgi:hypothetical protein